MLTSRSSDGTGGAGTAAAEDTGWVELVGGPNQPPPGGSRRTMRSVWVSSSEGKAPPARHVGVRRHEVAARPPGGEQVVHAHVRAARQADLADVAVVAVDVHVPVQRANPHGDPVVPFAGMARPDPCHAGGRHVEREQRVGVRDVEPRAVRREGEAVRGGRRAHQVRRGGPRHRVHVPEEQGAADEDVSRVGSRDRGRERRRPQAAHPGHRPDHRAGGGVELEEICEIAGVVSATRRRS